MYNNIFVRRQITRYHLIDMVIGYWCMLMKPLYSLLRSAISASNFHKNNTYIFLHQGEIIFIVLSSLLKITYLTLNIFYSNIFFIFLRILYLANYVFFFYDFDSFSFDYCLQEILGNIIFCNFFQFIILISL